MDGSVPRGTNLGRRDLALLAAEMPDDVVADRGDLFVGIRVSEWRHRVVSTSRSDLDAFKYGADNICTGGVVHAARAAKSRIVGLLTIAVPTVATRASRSGYLEADTLVAVRSGRPGRGAVQRGRMVIDPVGELGSLWRNGPQVSGQRGDVFGG